MELNKILENLCYYDRRNPDCIMEEEELKYHEEELKLYKLKCSCDNCFYGRTELAEELLKLKNISNEKV